jgi:hypothetical protein
MRGRWLCSAHNDCDDPVVGDQIVERSHLDPPFSMEQYLASLRRKNPDFPEESEAGVRG